MTINNKKKEENNKLMIYIGNFQIRVFKLLLVIIIGLERSARGVPGEFGRRLAVLLRGLRGFAKKSHSPQSPTRRGGGLWG
jgi:hypothetical protein